MDKWETKTLRILCSNICLRKEVKKKWSISHSVVSNSLQCHGLKPTRLLCLWDCPGKNTGVGSHSFLQGICSTQGSNPGLLHCRQILYHLSLHRSPAAAAKSLQSCPVLCDPIDGSPPGSAIPGILQARKLEPAAISFSNTEALVGVNLEPQSSEPPNWHNFYCDTFTIKGSINTQIQLQYHSLYFCPLQ